MKNPKFWATMIVLSLLLSITSSVICLLTMRRAILNREVVQALDVLIMDTQIAEEKPLLAEDGDPKKYNTPEAATYRHKAREKDELKNQSAVLTKQMKTIYDAYPVEHPNIQPDGMKQTLKCLD